MLIASAVGLVIGTLLGILGGGGSILAVPALVFLLGMDVTRAVPVALIVVAAGAAVGTVPKVAAGQVQWRLAAVFAVAGIPATVLGTAIGRLLPARAVLLGFAAVMVAAGARMLRDTADTGTACRIGESGINWRRCAPRSIPVGFVVGFLTGLFGVGGGFLIIPALVVMLGVEMPIAVGTSLVIIVANSLAALIPHLSAADIDWALTSAFVGAAAVASLIAARLGTRLDTSRLQRWFAYLVLGVAGYIVIDTLMLR